MSYPPIRILESYIVIWLQPLSDVVGVEQGDLRDLGEAFAAEHLDVRPGDDVNGCGTVRGAADSRNGLVAASRDDGVGGKERSEVRFTADGSDPGTTATVGNGESLRMSAESTRRREETHFVQIGMANVAADST